MTREEWLTKNNFNKDGETIAYVGGDSYARRAELKAAGWSYDKVLGWHIASLDTIDDNNMKIVRFEQIYQWDGNTRTGHTYREGAAALMDELRQRPKNTTSQFQGEPGQRFRSQKLKVISKISFNGKYGLSEIIKFEDAVGNLYAWFTSTFPDIEEGDNLIVDFSIKSHETYKGENITYITRAKIQ